MATRTSLLRYLTAALVAGFALSLAPSTSALADEDGARRKRMRTVYHAPRVVRQAPRVVHVVQPPRTVVQVRTRVVYVPQPVPVEPQPTYTCGGCAPVQTTCCAPAIAAPRYYGTGCSSCYGGQAGYDNGYGGYVGQGGYGGYYGGYGYRAAPYYWAVQHARYGYRHAWQGRRWH